MPLSAQQFKSSDETLVGFSSSLLVGEKALYFLVANPYSKNSLDDLQKISRDVGSFFLGKSKIELVDLRNFTEDLSKNWQVIVWVCERGKEILFGNVGGYVWMKKGDKWGFLSKKPKEISINKGLLERDDVLVVGMGDDMEKLTNFDGNDENAESQALLHKIFTTTSMGFSLKIPAQDLPLEEDLLDNEIKPTTMHIHGLKEKKRNNWWHKIGANKPSTANPEVYIKSDERRKLGRIVVLVLILLIASIGMGWRKRKTVEKNQIFNASYKPALQLLVDAESVMDDQPFLARDHLYLAKTKVEEALSQYEEDDGASEKLKTLLSQVQTLYEEVSGEHVISSAEVYFDLTLVKNDVFGEQMSMGDGWISVLDSSRNLVIGIEQETKKAKLLGGGDLLQGSKLLSASTGKAVVLSKKGLVGLYFGVREPGVLVEYDDVWEFPVALGMFGGNVYVVDSGVEEIWRYPGYDGGVGSRTRWLGPGVYPRLSEVIDTTVDGDIWTLSSGGGIAHFRRGAQMNFSSKGLDTPLDGATRIFSRLDANELYVLDQKNNRVVVFETTGEYKDQYMWDGMSGVSDLVVVDKEGEEGIILLLSGSSIYSIPLEK